MPELASLRSSLLSLPRELHPQFLASLSDDETLALSFDWETWARPNQLAPPGDWYLWIILAGRGFGKTRTGAEWVIQQARDFPGTRGALVAETPAEARDVQVEGESGILACSPPWFYPDYEPSKRRVTWPNGTIATVYSAFDFEKLRGPQHHWFWGDELAKWTHAQEAWDQIAFGLRLPPHARGCITTTPRPIPLLKDLLKRKTAVITRGTTYENLHNLAANVRDELLLKYEGTRLGRQELNAELLEDLEGALWSHDMLDRLRVGAMPPLGRVVVGVDPSGGSEGKNDEQGICVAALEQNIDDDTRPPRAVLLDDRSCKLKPDGWGRRAVQAAIDHNADCIVAEINYGGAMVEHVVQTAAAAMGVTVRVKVVTASRAKHVRAEPISALYDQQRVRHARCFPELEDELCLFTPNGYQGTTSPNHADAAIWALTELTGGAAPAGYDGLGEKIRGSWGRRR